MAVNYEIKVSLLFVVCLVGVGFGWYPKQSFVHIDCHPYPPDRRW